MPKSDKHTGTFLPLNILLLGLLLLTALILWVFYFFSLKLNVAKNSKSPLINVVTIGDESYDVVACPTGSVDATCTTYGGKELQDAINNAPDRPKDTPYKIFVKKGTYKGFVPLDLVLNESGRNTHTKSIFKILTHNLIITGEEKNNTIIDLENKYSHFFIVPFIETLKIQNLLFQNAKSIYYETPSDITLTDGYYCDRTNTKNCYYDSGMLLVAGYFSIFNSYSGFKYPLITVDNISVLNTNRFLDLTNSATTIAEPKIIINKSLTYNTYTSVLDIGGNWNADINASEFISYGSGWSKNTRQFATALCQDSSNVSIKNSVFLYSLGYFSSSFKSFDNCNATIYNSIFSKANGGGVGSTGYSKIKLVNSIVIDSFHSGLFAYDSSKLSVYYSYIYRNNGGVFDGNVEIVQNPLNNKYTDDPQIFFDLSDYWNTNTFNPLANSRSLHTGDSAILNVDGTRSNIGPAGGPDACLLRSYFLGCNGVVPSPTAVVSPTVLPTNSTTPTPSRPIGDVNGDLRIDITDIMMLIKEVFK